MTKLRPALALVTVLLWLVPNSACRRWNRPPAAPSEPRPDSGAVDRDTGVTLSWTCSDPDKDDELTFDLFIGTTATPARADTGLRVPRYRPTRLKFATAYFWRVLARDRHGYETVGPLWYFRTVRFNNPPTTPHRPVPDSSAGAVPVYASLYWSGGDADTTDTVTYDVYFGTSSPPPLKAERIVDTSYSPSLLAYQTTYYWRIVARDNHGAITEGPVWFFTTRANQAPNRPRSPRPDSGASGQLLRPVLGWTGGDPDSIDEVRYDVYLGVAEPLSRIDSGRLADSIVVPHRLKYDSVYLWRVVARDNHQAQAQGPTWRFRTASPLSISAPESLARIRALATQAVTWNGGPFRPGPRQDRRPELTRSIQRSLVGTRAVRQSESQSPDSAIVSYSTDNGASWLRQGRALQTGGYDWVVPYLPTSNGRIRVTEWFAQDTYVGVSSRFTVYDTLPPTRATVTAPALDTVWPEAGLRRITWTGGTDGLDSVVVFFSPDNRATWLRQGRSTTPGSYLWRVSGPASGQAYIRIYLYCLSRRDSATSFRFTVTEATYPDSVVATIAQDSLVSPRAMVWDSIDNTIYVANYNDSSVVAIDPSNSIRASIRTGRFPVALTWAAQRNRLYAACSLGGVTVINCAANSVIKEVATGQSPAALCWNATNNKVYCANRQDSTLTIIDGTSDSVLVHRRVGAGPSAACWHPTLNRVYVANSAANTVTVIDGLTNGVLATIAVGTEPVAVIPDDVYNQVFVINRGSSSVTVISAANVAFPDEFVPLGPSHAVWNPQQEKVYVACTNGNQVGAIHAVTRQVETFFVGSQPRGLAWMATPSRLYVANSGSATVSIVNCASNSVIKTLPTGRTPHAVCYNPFANRVYVANAGDGTITVIGR